MNNIFDVFANIFLLPSNKFFLVFFIGLGLFSTKRILFTKALIILIFSLILNLYLKSLWQIPLASHLGKGFAFPSGHMQAAVVFWGWLAWELQSVWAYTAMMIGLTGMGFSLVYCGYHNYLDVCGAIVFGLISLLIYGILYKTINTFYIAKGVR